MNILGINAYHGNASAAVVCDGRLVAAVEEERFNRVKYAAGFPAAAIRYCLKEAGLRLEEIDHVAVPRNPYARLGTKVFYALRMPSFARGRAKVLAKFRGVREALAAAFDSDPKTIRAQFHRIEHHQAHLASAFFVSPFERAALLSADGLGDFASTMWGSGSGSRMHIDDAIAFPHSLGLYYTAVTQYLGFLKFGDEYKVMGLAAYGEPEQLEAFRDIVRFDANGNGNGFRLGLDYFVHHRSGPEMSWAEADKTPTLGRLFSEEMSRRLGAMRAPEEALEQRHRNLAASLQARLEEVYLGMLRKLATETGLKSICLAGGVAFNCVANGKIFESTPFEQVYVQPAAGDVYVVDEGNNRVERFSSTGAYVSQWDGSATPAGSFSGPEEIAVEHFKFKQRREIRHQRLLRRVRSTGCRLAYPRAGSNWRSRAAGATTYRRWMTGARPHLENAGTKWSCVEQRVVEFIGRHLVIANVRGRFPEVIQRASETDNPRRSRAQIGGYC